MSSPSVKDVLDRHRKWLMSIPGVNGVAVGLSRQDNKERCIQLYVTTDELPSDVQMQIDGVKVEIVKTKTGFKPLGAK